MTNFVDSYLKSKNPEALEGLRTFVANMLPIVQGIAATSYLNEEGETVNVPAKGDPAYWYSCVRAPFPLPSFAEVELCTANEALPVCGGWL